MHNYVWAVRKSCRQSSLECNEFAFILPDFGASDDIDSDAFSPVQSAGAKVAQTNLTHQETSNPDLLLPHEMRRQKRLEQERLHFKRMTEEIKNQRKGKCTIERVHQPSKETFVKRFMKSGKPAILTGMMDSWDGTRSWDFSKLGKARKLWVVPILCVYEFRLSRPVTIVTV